MVGQPFIIEEFKSNLMKYEFDFVLCESLVKDY